MKITNLEQSMDKWKEKQCKCGNWFETTTTRNRTKCIVCRIKDGRKRKQYDICDN